MRGKRRPRQQLRSGGRERLASLLARDRRPARGERPRVDERAMPLDNADTVTIDQRVEIVRRARWVEPSRQQEGADNLRVERDSRPLELRFEKRVIEARVVRDEEPPGQSSPELDRNVGESRCARGQDDNGTGAGARCPWLSASLQRNEGSPFRRIVTVDRDDADLGDAVVRGVEARGFDIDESETPEVDPRRQSGS